MVSTLILSMSVVLQFLAAGLALRLIKVTGNRLAWMIVALAVFLMAVWRSITLGRIFLGGEDFQYQPDPVTELVALGISLCMVVGLAMIAPLFRGIKDSKDEVHVRAIQQEAVAKLGQRAWASKGIPLLMDDAVNLIQQTLQVPLCKILELLPEGKALVLRAGVGWREGYVGHGTVGAGLDSQAGYTLVKESPLIVEDLRTETRFTGPPLLHEHGVVSGISVIIQGKDQPFGVLGAHSTTPRVFSTDDVHFLQSVANVLAEALQREESEARYRSLVEHAPVCIHEISLEGKILSMNTTGIQMMGVTDECQVKGLPYLDAVVEEDRERIGALFSAAQQGESSEFEFASLIKNGEKRVFSSCFIPIKNADGTIQKLMGISQDITERQQAENTLRAIVEGTAAVTNADFFHSLLRHLTVALDAPYALIAECVDATNTRARTLGFLNKDTVVQNVEYALEGTPCEGVIAGKICYHPEDVQHLFPRDTILVELGVQCYLGLPLHDSSGKVIGFLVVMSQQPITFDAQTESLLRIFAARAGAELERKQGEEALRESEEHLRFVTDNSPVGIAHCDQEQRYKFVNRHYAEMFGRKAPDIVGMSPRELLGEDVYASASPYIEAVLAGQHPEYDLVLPATLHGQRTVRVSYAPERDASGHVAGFVASITDITERKQLELEHQTRSHQLVHQQKVLFELDKRESRTLDEALETFTEVTANTLSVERVSVWLFNNDHSHIVCQDLFKKSEHVHEKRHTLEAAHYPNYLQALEDTRVLAATQAHTDPRTSEFTESYLRPLEISSYMSVPIRRHGRMFGVICHEHTGPERDWTLDEQEFVASVADLVTLAFENWERTQAETLLKASEERYAMVMGAVNDGIWDWEVASETMYFSPAWKKQLGYEDDELQNVYEEWASRIHPEDYDRVMAALKDHFGWNRPYEVEYRSRHKNGNYVWILTRGACIRDEQGRPTRMFGANSDVTQRRHAEDQVRHADVQLRHAQKMNALGTLAGGIAHDFNNILAALMGYTELILKKVPYEETVQRYLNEVLHAGSRAKELVKQILTFSRQTEGQKKPLHFQEVVQEVLMLIRATLPSTITIQEQLSASSDLVQADATQIHQVLMNLCTNAEYAMRDQGGVLSVRLETVAEIAANRSASHLDLIPSPHLLLTVQDSGFGIPPEVLSQIFDPFFTTKKPGEGTGMGLAVVHGIIADHEGRITVTSTPGVGTTVAIVLPLLAATPADMAPDTIETDAELPSTVSFKPGQGQVLFVDDEAPLVALGKELLEELGYEVTTRISSLDALEAFRAAPTRYDILITDQTMPNLSGEALAREILRIRPDLPILLCTGFSHTMTEEKARELGFRKFLMKPLLRRDLVLAIQEVLEKVETKD